MDAVGELAQLLDRQLGLDARLGDQLRRARRIALEPRLGEAQRQGHADQALLGAVVQIALDAPPLLVGRGDDPLPGVAQVVDAVAQGARATGVARLAREADLLHRGCGGHGDHVAPARRLGLDAGCHGTGSAQRDRDLLQEVQRVLQARLHPRLDAWARRTPA